MGIISMTPQNLRSLLEIIAKSVKEYQLLLNFPKSNELLYNTTNTILELLPTTACKQTNPESLVRDFLLSDYGLSIVINEQSTESLDLVTLEQKRRLMNPFVVMEIQPAIFDDNKLSMFLTKGGNSFESFVRNIYMLEV
jgi:hypothetical protein